MSPLVRYLWKDCKIHASNYKNKRKNKQTPPTQTDMQFITFKGSSINIYHYLLQTLSVFYVSAAPPSAAGFPHLGGENSYSIAYFIFGEVSFVLF